MHHLNLHWKSSYISHGIRRRMRSTDCLASPLFAMLACRQWERHAGSHQKQQPALVPTGEQGGFGTAKTHWKPLQLCSVRCTDVCIRQKAQQPCGMAQNLRRKALVTKGLLHRVAQEKHTVNCGKGESWWEPAGPLPKCLPCLP